MIITEPPIASNLPAGKFMAMWTTPWANWFSAVWQQLAYLLSSPVKTVTAAYQITLTDSVILINGDVTVTLPTAAKGKDKRIICKAINAGVGNRTIASAGGTIDGAATKVIAVQYTAVDLVSNGTNWFIV